MSFLFSITPADPKRSSKKGAQQTAKTAITYSLVCLWCLLITFGLISAANPPWLANISEPGKEVEARGQKLYGDLDLRNGNYNAAVSQYLGALETKPDFIDAAVNLAITYGKMGMNEQAIATLEEALSQKPEQPDVVYYNLAEIYEKTGKTDEALLYFYKASDTTPFPMHAFRKIGSLHVAREEYYSAINAFQLALENRLTMKNYYTGMLKSTERTSDNSLITLAAAAILEKGVSDEDLAPYDNVVFEENLRHNEDISRIYNDIGFAYAKSGDLINAAPNFKTALDIWPENENAKNNLNAAMEIEHSGRI